MHSGETAQSGDERHRAKFPLPLVAPIVFAVLTLGMFFDVLFSGSRVLSASGTDLTLQFLHWRQFGFSEMRGGNLPLWNPHIYGGTPYFAGFQSALLYPPNWLHLVLPLTVAINWIIALHVFAAGYFTYLWCRGRGISVAGSILAGVMFMFGGPYFLHIYAGHLPHVCVMVWTPLILLAIDGLARSGRWGWVLLGAGAVAMQVLAGHPQYVYYTAIAATLYAALQLGSKHRLTLIIGFIAIYLGGALLSAVQLLPGIAVNEESVRGARTVYEFASTFSLPPRNFITLVAPTFFGNVPRYWGAGYLWEMSLFVSITGLIVAIHGIIVSSDRARWALVAMVGITLLFALGRHTPLYRLMYEYLPQYASFRGTVKFAYLAVLFISMLAAMGFDALRAGRRPAWTGIGAIGLGCVLLLIAAMWIRYDEPMWSRYLTEFVREYRDTGELLTRPVVEFENETFRRESARIASRALLIAAATGALAGAILAVSRFRPSTAWGLLGLAMLEMFIFARLTRATMRPPDGFPDDPQFASIYDAWERAIKELPPHARVLTGHAHYANFSMSMGYSDLWGYDPLVLRRYAELMFAAQNYDPDGASQNLALRMPPSKSIGALRMLRTNLILAPEARTPVYNVPQPLGVAALVGSWVELPERDSIFAFMLREDFDPARVAVIEGPLPKDVTQALTTAAPGTVELLGSDSDWIELRTTLDRPALLLVTNNFSDGWRVRSLDPSPQQADYRLMRANYVLQAVPLRAGSHHLRIEYAPREFRIGAWISVVALVLFTLALIAQTLRSTTTNLLMHPRRWFR